jgi:spermidine synthase
VLAVVTAFFGGLAFGALVFGARIHRSLRPERWYAACELAIALWSLALALLLAPVSAWMLDLTGPQPGPWWQWTVAFAGTFLVLLPATAAMGATLPAMERVLSRLQGAGPTIAGLYAANTLGAMLGVLAAAFWLVPEFGLARTAAFCAALNLFCGAAALLLPGQQGSAPLPAFSSMPAKTVSGRAQGRMLAVLATTGLLGIGFEVLVVRVLSQVTENTVYTFAILLAVYLVGTALGAAAYQRWRPEALSAGSPADPLRDRLLCLLATACLLGIGGLHAAEDIKLALQPVLDGGLAGALAVEAALALAAFALPTLVMGALFSHLCAQALAAGIGLGRALAFNTLGAAAAPLLFGVLLVPLLGPMLTLLLIVAGYLALSSAAAWRKPAAPALAGAVLTIAILAPPLAFIAVPEGGRVVSYRDGALAAVSVVEDAEGVLRLHIDNRQQEGSSATLLADARQALLPLLLHPAPQRALFLGLGTGMTASSAAADPGLQVDAVELLPGVIEASALFSSAYEGGGPNPRLNLLAADARRFVRSAGVQYDLIVSDNFHPARSGSGSLYTVEHFRAVAARLAPQGIFCQWLPLHQMDQDTLGSIVQAFIAVYPEGAAMLATHSLQTPVLGLVGRADGGRFELGALRARLAANTLPQRLADYGIADEFALLGGFVAGPSALARFAGDAPLNTDDRPVVAYRAPRITYAPDSLPRDRLLELLAQLHIAPGEVLDASTDADWPTRLAAYRKARDAYLAAGRDVRPSANVQAMLAQVREPLLAVLRISPDFRPAYDPLLRLAQALAPQDPTAAKALLGELAKIQPARPEAGIALRELATPAP